MKKLTLFKGSAMACLILMCLLLTQGCKKDLLQPNKSDLQRGISIAEAKAYFEKNLQNPKNKGKMMSVAPPEKRVSIENILAGKQPLWNSAFEKVLLTGIGIKVPIDFGNAYAIVNPKTQDAIPLSSLNYLFITKTAYKLFKPNG